MAYTFDYLERTARVLPTTGVAHWLIRLPLAAVLVQNGLEKFPLSADVAAGFGVPFSLWALAGVGEIAVAAMLLLSGMLRGVVGDLLTRLAGAGAAMIVAGVIYVAYWAPPLDLLLFNQFHILLVCSGLYLALAGKRQ